MKETLIPSCQAEKMTVFNKNTIQYNKCSSAQSTKYGRLCITMSVNEWDNN